jgi:hypothetical protein
MSQRLKVLLRMQCGNGLMHESVQVSSYKTMEVSQDPRLLYVI